MNRTIEISETRIVEVFREMCQESIPPDQYSYLVDEIIPRLKLARERLQDDYCPNKQYYQCLDLIVDMFKALPFDEKFKELKQRADEIMGHKTNTKGE